MKTNGFMNQNPSQMEENKSLTPIKEGKKSKPRIF
jgi:hypothetical protein